MNFWGTLFLPVQMALTIVYTQVTTTPVKNQDIFITMNLLMPLSVLTL